MSHPTKKYNIYFNFGPDESYFLRGIFQTRSHGNIAGRNGQWIDVWKKYDCVVWKSSFYFACRRKEDCINQHKIDGEADTRFKKWAQERKLSPLRLVISDKAGNWFAWMLHGDFLPGHNAPDGMVQNARDPRNSCTNIRIAALGADNTWLLIWENGEMRYDVKDKYPDLHNKLLNLQGDDVSWVALNPFRKGDYFLYVEKTKTASFQVSEAFGVQLKEVLNHDGIDTKDLVIRKQEVVTPTKIPGLITTNLVDAATDNVKINGGDAMRAAGKIMKTAIVVVKAGAMLGAVACSIM